MSSEQPPYTPLENITLAAATLVLGVMAGFFWAYTYNVNLAMLQVDGETYARVQSLFNRNVRHGMFFFFFFGGGAFSLLALVVNRRRWATAGFWLIVVAVTSYIVGVIVFTQQINLPLNYYTESWDPANVPADWQDVRAQWNSANAIRVGTSAVAFASCLLALLLRANTRSAAAQPTTE